MPDTTERVGPPASATFEEIPPEEIRRNPSNPRLKFPQEQLEALAESFEEVGVLVPVTVYAEEDDDGHTHVLLDGERRWQAARLIDYPALPAWVVEKPHPTENTLRMFNIHHLREEWSNIATAWALKNLIEELGTNEVEVLHRKTGLSKTQIRNSLTVLSFPFEWQQAVYDEQVPYNLLVELDKAVLSKARRDPELVQGFTEEHLRETFLNKYVGGLVGDVVDMRKVRDLINAGRQETYAGKRAKEAFRVLVEDPEATIEDAFEEGAAASVEMKKVLRDIEALPVRISNLLDSNLTEGQHAKVIKSLRRLEAEIGAVTG